MQREGEEADVEKQKKVHEGPSYSFFRAKEGRLLVQDGRLLRYGSDTVLFFSNIYLPVVRHTKSKVKDKRTNKEV